MKKGDRLFAVYDRNGNIKSIHKEPYDAFEAAVKLNKKTQTDDYIID